VGEKTLWQLRIARVVGRDAETDAAAGRARPWRHAGRTRSAGRGGRPCFGAQPVERAAQIGGGVRQRAVQVEEDGVNHHRRVRIR
jgi:hypothetical protein